MPGPPGAPQPGLPHPGPRRAGSTCHYSRGEELDPSGLALQPAVLPRLSRGASHCPPRDLCAAHLSSTLFSPHKGHFPRGLPLCRPAQPPAQSGPLHGGQHPQACTPITCTSAGGPSHLPKPSADTHRPPAPRLSLCRSLETSLEGKSLQAPALSSMLGARLGSVTCSFQHPHHSSGDGMAAPPSSSTWHMVKANKYSLEERLLKTGDER